MFAIDLFFPVCCARSPRRASSRAPIDKKEESCIQRQQDVHALPQSSMQAAPLQNEEEKKLPHMQRTRAKSSSCVAACVSRESHTCILSDVNTSVSTSQAMMVTISSFIFIDGITLRGG